MVDIFYVNELMKSVKREGRLVMSLYLPLYSIRFSYFQHQSSRWVIVTAALLIDGGEILLFTGNSRVFYLLTEILKSGLPLILSGSLRVYAANLLANKPSRLRSDDDGKRFPCYFVSGSGTIN